MEKLESDAFFWFMLENVPGSRVVHGCRKCVNGWKGRVGLIYKCECNDTEGPHFYCNVKPAPKKLTILGMIKSWFV